MSTGTEQHPHALLDPRGGCGGSSAAAQRLARGMHAYALLPLLRATRWATRCPSQAAAAMISCPCINESMGQCNCPTACPAVEACCKVITEFYGPNSTLPSRNCFCVEAYWTEFNALEGEFANTAIERACAASRAASQAVPLPAQRKHGCEYSA